MHRHSLPSLLRLALPLLLLALLSVACGGPRVTPALKLPLASVAAPTDALQVANEGYYAAPDAAAMRRAVEEARAINAESALYHEIAADLAELEGRTDDRFAHLLAAIRDPNNDVAGLHIRQLAAEGRSAAQQRELVAVLESVVAGHLSERVRSVAAFTLARLYQLLDATEDLAGLAPTLGFRLPLAVIGPWDNDQGKGFDVEYPPEREIDLEATYPGAVVDIGWRREYPVDPVAGRTHLDYLMEPYSWKVAYAVSAVRVAEAGDYELRLSTNSPLKIWVNDLVVFANPKHRTDFEFDGFVVPVQLRRGVNRVLIKVAQRDDGGILLARLTGTGGALAPEGVFTAVAPQTAWDGGDPPASGVADDLTSLVATIDATGLRGLRKGHYAALWAAWTGMRTERIKLLEPIASSSLRLRVDLARALWSNEESARTADLLDALDAEHTDLVDLRLLQTRFWLEKQRRKKVRDALLAMKETWPDRPEILEGLVALFRREAWLEDECTTLAELDRRWPEHTGVLMRLASCLERQDYRVEQHRVLQQVLALEPNHLGALREQYDRELRHEHYGAAEVVALRMAQRWPHSPHGWRRVADARRRRGDRAGAEAAWREVIQMVPTWSEPYEQLARLAYEAGETDKAVALWLDALSRDPEDEALANRIAYLNPVVEGPWVADIPDEAAIDAAVAAMAGVKLADGANIVDLLDHEVTNFSADGSQNRVVTTVQAAVNEAGRDVLTRYTLPSSSARILHAYAIDRAGKRSEASSVRGRAVRFRSLEVGSIVVVQYRVDERARGYLHGELTNRWYFQGSGIQKVAATWVLWTPVALDLTDFRIGDITVEQDEREGRRRTAYAATDVPPFTEEPFAPAAGEFIWHVVVSSIKDWGAFWQWEEALMHDAFRSSPELEALAQALGAGADDPNERLLRIQTWIAENIRYQQDYEGFIEGVRPHAAPVVVSRRYGDCKDKAVLFITLARLIGLDAHFALVRTRPIGPAVREVPHQQFNHVIVYVPDQEGVQARFFDPTVDALDPQVLRADDQGTWSLVMDFVARTHTWRQIPFQAPEVDYTDVKTTLALTADGAVKGRMELVGVGRSAQGVRQSARNAQRLRQLVQNNLGSEYRGATVLKIDPVEVTDLRKPMALNVEFEAPALGRREGRELRVRLPASWPVARFFDLGERKLPIGFDRQQQTSWTVELELPAGATVKRLPAAGKLGTECLAIERKVRSEKGKVIVSQTARVQCERITTEHYGANREAATAIERMLDEELVITVPK